jgi:hypothetical protein
MLPVGCKPIIPTGCGPQGTGQRGFGRATKQEERQMAYVLGKITPEDQQKIIDDAVPRVRKYLGYAQKDGKFPTSWAIDRERNHYLLRGPMYFREDVYHPYHIFAYGRMYLFRRQGNRI